MNRFQFVADLHRRYGVKLLCSILGISRSSFYYWRRTAADRAARQAADARLAALIRAVHQDSDGTYGAPRITSELRETSGEALNHKRVARIMRAFGIEGVRLRRRHRTTVADPAAAKAPDLIGRDFTATAPNTKYVGSGSRRELPPPAPTEPCVTVSRYTALVTLSTRSDGQTASGRTSLGIAV
ncbi:Transposase [Streptomyces microflavus DSM 40593]|uniref:Transposase n=1 Tax=Streptomyces microflavus DSM 40593 TaxID=1303692 RepID=N0D1C5_STRMI|nr:Transposase [Streptomyces microflavus DSM 40593]